MDKGIAGTLLLALVAVGLWALFKVPLLYAVPIGIGLSQLYVWRASVADSKRQDHLWVTRNELRVGNGDADPVAIMSPATRLVVRTRIRRIDARTHGSEVLDESIDHYAEKDRLTDDTFRTLIFDLLAIDNDDEVAIATFEGAEKLTHAMYVRQCIQEAVGIEDVAPKARQRKRRVAAGDASSDDAATSENDTESSEEPESRDKSSA